MMNKHIKRALGTLAAVAFAVALIGMLGITLYTWLLILESLFNN